MTAPEIHGDRLIVSCSSVDAEGRDRREDGEDDAEPARMEAVFEYVHRATGHLPLRRGDAVLHGQQCFGVLGGDAEHAGQPHPEDGPRSAGTHGAGDPDDVAGPDRGRQRCGECPELTDVAFAFARGVDRKPDRRPEIALNEA
jgi:hypothetical protein